MFTEMQVADGSINHLIIDLHAHPQLKPLNSGDSERDLLEIGLNKMKVRELMYGYDPQELTEKLMSKNILDFMEKYFQDSYLKKNEIRPV